MAHSGSQRYRCRGWCWNPQTRWTTSFILDDRSGRLEVTMFEDVYQQFRSLVSKDAILVVEGGLRWDDFIDDWRLSAEEDHGRRPGA